MMKIDDILEAAIQDAGLNLEDDDHFNTADLYEHDTTAHTDPTANLMDHTDPFTQAVQELEMANQKADALIQHQNLGPFDPQPTQPTHPTQAPATPTQFKHIVKINTFNHAESGRSIRVVTLNKNANSSDLTSLMNYRSSPTNPPTPSTPSNAQIKIVNLKRTPLAALTSPSPPKTSTTIIQIPKLSPIDTSKTAPPPPRPQTDSKSVKITKVVSSRPPITHPTPTAPKTRPHVYYNPHASINHATHFLNTHAHQQASAPLIRICASHSTPHPPPTAPQPVAIDQPRDEEIVVDEEEELGHAETYADYMPAKLQIGMRHPDPVVETSSLASVEPPEVWYRLRMPEHVYAEGALSALQLEAIVYASQKHECYLPNSHRAGFLIGDGAGVGKGRTIAGIIYENYLHGRKKALWLSVSNDLKYDAERDFSDIGASRIDVHALNKLKYAKVSSKANGKIKKGVIFATYSSLIGESQHSSTKKKYSTRLKQLLQWLGRDFDGVIVFDECHKAKNLVPVGSAKPTKTGLAVLELQEKLPNARIVYASATGASEPKNMAYMVRLGLWGPGTPFSDFNEFIQCVEKRGVGAMEIVAMDMKLRGMYMARQLSFAGVTFRVEEIKLSDDYVSMYDESVRLWVEMKERFQEALELVDRDGKLRKTVWGQFWSSHQRFFKYLCMACKVTHVVDLARNALHSSRCVVIGLQSTGEARTLEQLDEYGEISEFVSTARGVLLNLIEKHFPSDSAASGDGAPKSGARKGSAAKNSKKVTEIVKRLSSYANNVAAANGQRKKGANSSSDNCSESGTNSSSSDNEEDNEMAENDEDEFFEGDEADEEDFSEDCEAESGDEDDSGDEEDEEDDEDDDDEEETASHDLNNNTVAPPPPNIKVRNDDSEDSDSLFSINRSNITFHRVPKAPVKIKKKKKKIAKKKVEATTTTEVNGSDGDEDDEFKLPIKRIKLDTVPEKLSFETVRGSKDPARVSQYLTESKERLLAALGELSRKLPANTLDELIDSLDGPEYVAEMTGRKGRVVCHDEGNYVYEARSESDVPLELLNVVQKERFMNGEKLIAIISEAASSGISLQANRRCANQRRRVHITIELPWSADRAIQQFGRTHRSNQVSAPEYIFLISELAGEKRFASTVAKRLESLGALTHGDRRATESRDLSRFNIDNKYGRAALENVIKSICGMEKALARPPGTYKGGSFMSDARNALIGVGLINVGAGGKPFPDKDYTNINKFLNRLLGCPVHLQNAIFTFFSDVLASVILEAKRTGKWDMGILDLGTNNETVVRKETKYYVLNTQSGVAGESTYQNRVELNTVLVERGFSWEKAMELGAALQEPEGFYLSNQVKNGHTISILVLSSKNKQVNENGGASEAITMNSNISSFCIYRPNTGLQVRQEMLDTLLKKYKRVAPHEAKTHWQEQYFKSATECTHVYRQGICTNKRTCEIGLRNRRFHILAGSVLTVWTKVENVLCSLTGSQQFRLQIIRIRTKDNKKIVGCVIPSMCLGQVDSLLNSLSSRTYKQDYSNEDDPIVIDDGCEAPSSTSLANSSGSASSGSFFMNIQNGAGNGKNIFNYVKGSNNSYEQIGTASSYRYANANGTRMNGNGVGRNASFHLHMNHLNVAANRNLEFI